MGAVWGAVRSMQCAGSASRECMGHRGVQGVWEEHERCRGRSRNHVGRQKGAGGMIESWGQDRQEMQGECVGRRGMQGEQSWCQGRGEGRTLTRVCSSESPVSAAMRHSVVGSGCLFTLQKLYSRISSCSSVGVTGFSVAISSWGRAMGPGTAERGRCHCPGWEWPVGPHLLSPMFAIPVPISSPLPTGLWLWQGTTPFPKACRGAQPGAPATQQLQPQFPHCGDRTPTAPS